MNSRKSTGKAEEAVSGGSAATVAVRRGTTRAEAAGTGPRVVRERTTSDPSGAAAAQDATGRSSSTILANDHTLHHRRTIKNGQSQMRSRLARATPKVFLRSRDTSVRGHFASGGTIIAFSFSCCSCSDYDKNFRKEKDSLTNSEST